jgi:D-lactate dehydrogenase
MDLNGKTCGVAGTGLIGSIAADIFRGVGMNVIVYDKFPNDKVKEKGFQYVELDELYAKSDVITLHVPLLPATTYMINKESIGKMKPGVILINCARGKVIKTSDLIEGLQDGKIGGVGLDVYEKEAEIFFNDFTSMSDEDRLQSFDPQFAVLKSFPNVVITPHTAFLTNEALRNICDTTIQNIEAFIGGQELKNECKPMA